MLAAIAAYTLGSLNERARGIFVFITVILCFALNLILALYYPDTELRLADNGVLALHFRLDGFRTLYGCITAFLWLVTSIFSQEYFANTNNGNRYWLFNLLTFGATIGVFFSADFRTAFLFFEAMSLTSYALVAHDENPAALRAAETCLAVAIIGGLAMLMGMLMLQQTLGTLEFSALYKISSGLKDNSPLYLPGALLTVGFGAKAGMFPLHIWLPKAHPAAPAPASALLSGILIKTGVFGIAAVSCNIFFNDYTWAVALLIPSAITMVLGAVLAVFSNDLKRTLACSSVSQIGLILTGIAMQIFLGEHNALAVRGTLLHMLNHSLSKLVLFSAAGIVYMNCHELELDKIRGFGRGKPLFLFVFFMAAFSICGLPFWSGYISKTLLHESIIEAIQLYDGHSIGYYLQLIDTLFLFTGGLTFAYMAKLFVALFTGRKGITSKKKPYISRSSAVALTVSAALLPLAGSFPVIMDILAAWGQGFFHSHVPDYTVHYFTPGSLKIALTSIVNGTVIYVFIVHTLLTRRKEEKIYSVLWPKWLDLENLVYRPLLRLLFYFGSLLAFLENFTYHLLLRFLLAAATFVARLVAALPTAALRRPSWQNPVKIGAFSINLLFVGTGVCIVLVYILSQVLLR